MNLDYHRPVTKHEACHKGPELRTIALPNRDNNIDSGIAITLCGCHDDVIKWKHFPRNWTFVWGIHRSPVNLPHNRRWLGASMFSLVCAWINGWVNNRGAGDLMRHSAHYDVIVMSWYVAISLPHHDDSSSPGAREVPSYQQSSCWFSYGCNARLTMLYGINIWLWSLNLDLGFAVV